MAESHVAEMRVTNGESGISDRNPASNGGTWQFWDLLGQVALGFGNNNRQPRRAKASWTERLRWKVEVLERLERRGIWLDDASPIGLYAPGGQRLVGGGTHSALVGAGYGRVVWPGVVRGKPGQVWVIGRTVGSALSGLPGIDPDRVVSQPQDRDRDRYLADLRRLCAEVQAVAP